MLESMDVVSQKENREFTLVNDTDVSQASELAVPDECRCSIDSEWQQWIDTNIARGCSIAALRETLIENGFSPDAASVALPGPREGFVVTPEAQRVETPAAEMYVLEDFLSESENTQCQLARLFLHFLRCFQLDIHGI